MMLVKKESLAKPDVSRHLPCAENSRESGVWPSKDAGLGVGVR